MKDSAYKGKVYEGFDSQKNGKSGSVSLGGILTPSSTTVAFKPNKEQLKKLAVNLNRVIQQSQQRS